VDLGGRAGREFVDAVGINHTGDFRAIHQYERIWHRRGFQRCMAWVGGYDPAAAGQRHILNAPVIDADPRLLFAQNCSIVYRVDGINHANH
jgi:hypothetical protein